MKQVGVTNQNDVVIIISDGYGESQIENYGFRNVIWVMVESKTNTLSVREQDIRGHLVAYLEDDYRYKIEENRCIIKSRFILLFLFLFYLSLRFSSFYFTFF